VPFHTIFFINQIQEEGMNDTGYDYSIVRGFAFSALFWLVVGLVIGLWIAFEMFNPALNLTHQHIHPLRL